MDVSNTISRDSIKPIESTYSKNSLSNREIQHSIPETKVNKVIDKFEKIESLEKPSQREQLNDIKKIIFESNKDFRTFDRRLDISVHEKTSEVMVKVVDTLTEKVIKELPAEEVLDTLAKRREIIGIMIDKQI